MLARIISLDIDLTRQMLTLNHDGRRFKDYLISTAANGPGEQQDSGCTPRGRHCIRAKIGEGLPVNSVLVGRRPTGEIYRRGLKEIYPNRDWILTRILWLSGCEPGVNRLGNVDTMRRYIYIHGAPDEVVMGKPGSKGCIRMQNQALLALFSQVEVGTRVDIHA